MIRVIRGIWILGLLGSLVFGRVRDIRAIIVVRAWRPGRTAGGPAANLPHLPA